MFLFSLPSISYIFLGKWDELDKSQLKWTKLLFYYKTTWGYLQTISGSCLECYHCSGKIAADCRDPFPPESNATGLVNCSTLRTRGLNVLNIYNSLLQNVTAFKALGPEPHVCYKLYGNFSLFQLRKIIKIYIDN